MLTASKIDLAMKCQGAFALPGIVEVHGGQDEGNDRHEEHEEDIESGNTPELYAARWPGYTWRSEVSFAIDLATGVGRVLGVGLDRAYDRAGAMKALGIEPLGPFEISGTADAVGRGPMLELVIVDLKSFDPNVTRAEQNAQLKTLALMATRALNVDECEVAINHQLRPFDVAALSSFDLDLFEAKLKATLETTVRAKTIVRQGGTVPLNPGAHCRYCPAFMGPQGIACPAQKEMQLEVSSADFVMQLEQRIPFESDEEAAFAFDLYQRVQMMATRLKTTLFARAAERPIPLPDGKVFGPRPTRATTRLNGDETYKLLRAQYGEAIADAATERKTTQDKIETALKMTGRPVAPQKKKLLAELEARGALTKTSGMKIDVHDAEVPRLKTG